MGCGPDVFRLVEVADQVLQRHRAQDAVSAARPAVSQVDPWAEALRLYEQGLIDDAALERLRRLAEQGQLRPVDVAVLRFEAQKRGQVRHPLEEEEGLRLLRARRARLLRAQEASRQVIQRLERQIAALEERAQEKEQAARAVIARDEVTARRLLQEKLVFEETKARLEEQARGLREDLQTLEDVIAQIEAKILELEAVQARADLHSRHP